MLEASLFKLLDYIEKENYIGYDPYDLLKSPLFKLPLLKSNKKIRFFAQQFGKRLPFNIRPLLRVPKGYNPVTIGLAIQSYSYLYSKTKEQKYLSKIDHLINELTNLIPSGFSGACWGYDFPWEARYASIPAYQPTVVATGIITNGLFECYRLTQNIKALNLCISASDFVIKDLQRTESDHGLCFSYSPFDKQQVFNASMKGVRLLSQVYSITKNEEFFSLAKMGVEFVVENQNADGSWSYSLAKKGGWIDNYHTGYILDCLDEYIKCTGDNQFNDNLKKGYDYYLANFFDATNLPKFYNHNLYPIDCTAAGQSLLTLTRFGDIDKAVMVAERVIESMQHPNKGYFYFRRFKFYSQRTSFMRWSNAWMLVGLSSVLSNKK